MSDRTKYLPYLDDRIQFAEQELLKEDSKNLGVIPGQWTSDDHIPAPLVDAYINAESGWDPNAHNDSPCGPNGYASGLGQFCVSPTGESKSLEIGDYQSVTGSRVTLDDVYDPLTAMEITAFGLGDRYERLKEKTGKPKPKNWYLAVVGMSPLGLDQITDDTTVPEPAKSYVGALRDYVTVEYGADIDKQIAGEKPSGDSISKTCSGLPFWEKPLCLLGGLESKGVDKGKDAAGNYVQDQLWPIMGIGIGAMAVLGGIVLLVKHNNPTAIAARELL